MNKNNKGFTLIEVMVAVGVIAIALPALMIAMMQQVDGTAYLRDKLQAQWVAENIMEEMRIQNRVDGSVPTSNKKGKEELGGRKWFWKSRSKAFEDKNLQDIYGIEVSVWENEQDVDESPLVKLVGIIRQYKPEAINVKAGESLP